MKCITRDCENHVGEGYGLFLLIPQELQTMRWICSSCWNYITKDPTPKADFRDRKAAKAAELKAAWLTAELCEICDGPKGACSCPRADP